MIGSRASNIGAVYMMALMLFALVYFASAQLNSVSVRVSVDRDQEELPVFWNFFGYDEPNYTYATNGKKLLQELGRLSRKPVYVRVHNLFTSGDGLASLKWGSTNVYTEEASGRPVYSWKIVDRIFDTFLETGITPLVEIGFMPQAMSTHPEPYRHRFPAEPGDKIYKGWAYPPKDYGKWSELVFQFVRHLRERYGDQELKSWLWEVWNEPDIAYWQGTPEEYFRLYDYSVDAVLRAFPQAKVGGPDSTGPASPRAAQFLRMFLDHCARQKNYVTGKTGARLDFISFHPKGAPIWREDHVRMGLSNHLAAIKQGFEIVKSFPEWGNTPVVLGESDPEGCAACSARNNPANSYRNGPLYAAYEAEVLNSILSLSAELQVNVLGTVTWAFEFENQPYFEGFRTLATNGVDKPVLNAFRMFGLMNGMRVQASSSGALPTEDVVRNGVRGKPDINVIASRNQRGVDILVWNYHDDDLFAPEAAVDLVVSGIPGVAGRALVEHFRVDSNHSNAFAEWKRMGSPQTPSAEQYQQLQSTGELQLLNSPRWLIVRDGKTRLEFGLPRQALSLVRIAW